MPTWQLLTAHVGALLLFALGFAVVTWWKYPRPRRVPLPIAADELVAGVLRRIAERDANSGVTAQHVERGLERGLFTTGRSRKAPLSFGFIGPWRESDRARESHGYRVYLGHAGELRGVSRRLRRERRFDDLDWQSETIPPDRADWTHEYDHP